ncbi:MAG: hypothetical protein ACRC33_15265 [Gemmataceae bacterium]
MTSIMITLKPETDPKEKGLVERLGRVAGVNRVHALNAASRSAAVRRIYYAEVKDGADVEAVRREIAAAPDVETAEVPAERRLTPPAPKDT